MKVRLAQVLVLFPLLWSAVTFSACGGGGDNGSPASVVKATLESIKAKDKDRLKKCLSKYDLSDEAAAFEVLDRPWRITSYEIGATAEDGDKATVFVTYRYTDGGTPDRYQMHCRKEGGEWKFASAVTQKARQFEFNQTLR